MNWTGEDFSGTKLALICGDQILTYLRDDFSRIPFPGHWDLPGGGREDQESPIECGLRETREEFSLVLPASRISAIRKYPPQSPAGLPTYFGLLRLHQTDVSSIQFGDEGQTWRMMTISEFIEHPKAVPHLQTRLHDLLSDLH